MDGVPRYEYTPLKVLGDPPEYKPGQSPPPIWRTRLVTIEPAERSDPIICSLSIVDLSDKPEYEALSYVWGTSEDRETIICSGGSLPVTLNLHSGLKHLRYREKPRVIWIDAICINQEDIEERAEQVRFMGDIYSSARRTVIWLGEDGGIAADVFDMIRWLNDQVPLPRLPPDTDSYTFASSENYRKLIRQLRRAVESDYFQHFKWTKFANLFENPWFSRIWIVQEVAKAPQAIFRWGDCILDWESLLHFSVTFVSTGMLNAVLSPIHGWDQILTEKIYFIDSLRNAPPRFIDILHASKNFDSLDPRDKLFAVIGLALDRTDIELTIDYQIDFAQLYWNFVMQYTMKHQNLDLLGYVMLGRSRSRVTMPSWVPDWRNSNRITMQFKKTVPYLLHKSGGNAMPNFCFSDNGNVLTVLGKPIGSGLTIGTVTGEDGFGLRELYSEIQRSVKERYSCASNHHLAQVMKAMFALFEDCETIAYPVICTSANCVRDQADYFTFLSALAWETAEPFNLLGTKALESYRLLADTLRKIIDHLEGNRKLNMNKGRIEGYAHFESIQHRASGRRFCRTSSGHLGWVPESSVSTDQICVLLGSKFPVVLRKIDDGFYEFVGECYIQGIMRGEAANDDSIRTEAFHIR